MRYIRQTSDPLNSFVAGLIAGGSLFLDKNKSRRLMIALYLSTRTGHFICRWLWRHYVEIPKAKEKNRRLLELSNPCLVKSSSENELDEDESIQVKQEKIIQDSLISHEWYQELKSTMRQATSVFLMSLSCSQIIYSFVCEPDSLASPYRSFLITHCGLRKSHPTREKEFIRVLGDTVKSSNYGTTKYLNSCTNLDTCMHPSLPLQQISQFSTTKSPFHDFVLCQLQHPNDPTCTLNFIKFTIDAFQRALYLYVPLNVVMSLVYKGKKAIQEPLQLARRILTSSIRSSIFLMTCSASAWALPCLMRKWYGTDRPWMYYINGFFAGSSVLLEVPGRRLELAMYCLPRALESFWNCGVKWGWWRNMKFGEAIYFCLSTGFLMCLYQDDPESIHEGYRKVMVRMIGYN